MLPKKRAIGLILGLLILPVVGLVQHWANPFPAFPDLETVLTQVDVVSLTQGPANFCLGGPEFMAALASDQKTAQSRALVQTLSFEGDAAGTALAEALMASPATEKCLIIDSYSRLVQSDQMVGSPVRMLNFGLYRERARMNQLVQNMRESGVDVYWGRPFGFQEDNLTARDHKKMCVIDDVAYVGGNHFSDHNFMWRDLMLRLNNKKAADALAHDFQVTLLGRSENSRHTCGHLDLVVGQGSGDPAIMDRLAGSIAQADSTIFLECPYITEPLFEMLGTARERGVQSANFDFLSGALQPELLAISTDPILIAQFNQRIKEPSLRETWNWSETGKNPRLASVGRAGIGLAAVVLNWVHSRKGSSRASLRRWGEPMAEKRARQAHRWTLLSLGCSFPWDCTIGGEPVL